ncbi:hypothetical protein SCHPADRAFT_617487 [Schizopora paradoxa]|uniref:Uncharacterized protein n=1 Tax=Schizopora paradoxa TaxID=27342 RepID=A0A0H2RTP0_9AGAM|nr:hypothetical protein SCHPADRAFT_617487 [Schizopora paradoxa]
MTQALLMRAWVPRVVRTLFFLPRPARRALVVLIAAQPSTHSTSRTLTISASPSNPTLTNSTRLSAYIGRRWIRIPGTWRRR